MRKVTGLIITAAVAAALFSGGIADCKNAISYNRDGWEHLKKGDYTKAIFSFKNAVKANPRYGEALIGLATAYLEVEAYEQSFDLFTSALKIDPESVRATVGMGKTLAGLGRYSQALGYYEKALKLAEGNLDARYGMAEIYYMIGKRIWAKRALDTILKMNPYHYDSLLLLADLKADENRISEARKYVEKAVDSSNENPRGYVKLGELLLREYLSSDKEEYLNDAAYSVRNALSIQPQNKQGNRLMGYISLLSKNYQEAAGYFGKSSDDGEDGGMLYGLAVSYDLSGDYESSVKYFLEALKKSPSDSLLRSRFEDFLVFRDFKIGHPARIMLNSEAASVANARQRKGLPDQATLYYRRAILLNPMNIEARETLMEYYSVNNYHSFYIDELKELQRLFPGNRYRERLGVAIIKRRGMLYQEEGYAMEEPPRDVPSVLVLNFNSGGRITEHPDAGEVIASNLNFALGQFGRMKTYGLRKRSELSSGLMTGDDHMDGALESVSSRIKSSGAEPADYMVYGSFREGGGHVTVECRLLDFKKGFIIGEFTLTETGRYALYDLSVRSARRIYDMMPFRGKVLKVKDAGIVFNMGLYDGLKNDDKVVIYKFNTARSLTDNPRKKIIFKIKNADTLISYAEPERESDLEEVNSSDQVLPLRKRRAKKLG